jgi:hypothetical protein
VGIAALDPTHVGGDYGYDIPGQLLEYTIISQNPADGSAFPNANDPRGRSLIDFDVSYVDYAHLPYAMALGDGGATQFMGSAFGTPGPLPVSDFPRRLSEFIDKSGWSGFAAYAPLHWARPDDCAKPPAPDGGPANLLKTRFSCLIPQTAVVPSAAILIATAKDGGTSGFFKPETYGGYSTKCVARDGENAQCAVLLPNNVDCCPDPVNGMLGCCDIKNFQIDKVLSKWLANPQKPTDPNAGTIKFSNPTLDNLVARFDAWRDRALPDPCGRSGAGIEQAPVIDRNGFCTAYKKTIDFVWGEFVGKCAGMKKDALDRCVVSAIIGFDVASGYNPAACVACTANPETCPASCVVAQINNESVQAIQRGLPWTPAGPPATCGGCPSGDLAKCPAACVFPKVNSPEARIYHFDKFLHFWAPYDSVYNVNPYARFIHAQDGVAAPGAYSFSIDDFYGNFGGFASTLIIQAGGYSKLPNREPYDPYKQYTAGFGPGWNRVSVCGRLYKLPPNTPSNVGITPALSFWNDGTQLAECEVRAYPDAGDTYVAFQVKEVSLDVVDSYTGRTQKALGLAGVCAPRGGQTPPDPYCLKNSTAKGYLGSCSANLVAGSLNKDYVAVTDANCRSGLDPACGKPLVSLNIPPPTQTAPPNVLCPGS